jgi:hypothetical protein
MRLSDRELSNFRAPKRSSKIMHLMPLGDACGAKVVELSYCEATIVFESQTAVIVSS